MHGSNSGGHQNMAGNGQPGGDGLNSGMPSSNPMSDCVGNQPGNASPADLLKLPNLQGENN